MWSKSHCRSEHRSLHSRLEQELHDTLPQYTPSPQESQGPISTEFLHHLQSRQICPALAEREQTQDDFAHSLGSKKSTRGGFQNYFVTKQRKSNRESKKAVVRVSSHRTTSESFSTVSARSLMSLRQPMGVLTRCLPVTPLDSDYSVPGDTKECFWDAVDRNRRETCCCFQRERACCEYFINRETNIQTTLKVHILPMRKRIMCRDILILLSRRALLC